MEREPEEGMAMLSSAGLSRKVKEHEVEWEKEPEHRTGSDLGRREKLL